MKENEEVWCPVPSYEDRYTVSNRGQVRSLLTGRPLTPILINSGYLSVHLYRDGKRKPMLVHRLVAACFLGSPPTAEHEVNHIDYDRLNNCVGNLAWVTHSANCRHSAPRNTFGRRAVVGTPIAGTVGYYFPSQVAAELHILGALTGIVSWSLKTQRPALGFHWSRV